MEAGGDRHWPRPVWRLLCHWPRPRPGRVMGDGLTTVSAVYIHPNTAAVVLFTLGEAISPLQTILNIKTDLTDSFTCTRSSPVLTDQTGLSQD